MRWKRARVTNFQQRAISPTGPRHTKHGPEVRSDGREVAPHTIHLVLFIDTPDGWELRSELLADEPAHSDSDIREATELLLAGDAK